MRHMIWIATLALASAACTHYTADGAETTTANAAAEPVAAMTPADHDRLAFVQAACGGCHAVETNDLSPVPDAPRWVDIANREGLDRGTLARWLRDAHNYPEMMDFDLDSDQVDMIAAYILTLRSADYKRAPD